MSTQKGFSIIAVLLALLGVGAVIVTVVILMMKFGLEPPADLSGQEGDQEENFAAVADLPACGSKRELLTHSPLDLVDFTAITPLGLLSPTAHVFPAPHLYFNVRRTDPGNYNSLPVEIPVVSPADLTITTMKFIEATGRPAYDDGFIEFGVCREFKAYFDHLKTFAPKIKQAYDSAQVDRCDEYSLSYPKEGEIDYKVCRKTVNIHVQKGEKIGTAGGGDGQKVFDFGAFDERVIPKQFANPSRWRGREHHVYLVCALDYFPESLKTELKARLGGPAQAGPEVRGADCGEVIQDIPGTAMGAWVPPGTDQISHEPPYLALVHENIEPQYLVFSMGDSADSAGLPHGKYTFLPRNEGFINRHFQDIKADDNIYCFETENTYQPDQKLKMNILVAMPSPTKLRVQRYDAAVCGSGPWNLTNSVEFVR